MVTRLWALTLPSLRHRMRRGDRIQTFELLYMYMLCMELTVWIRICSSQLSLRRQLEVVHPNSFRKGAGWMWEQMPLELEWWVTGTPYQLSLSLPHLWTLSFSKPGLTNFGVVELHHILTLGKMRLVIRLNQHVTMSILHTDTVTLPQIKTIREGRWNLGPVPQISLSLSLRWWTSHRIAC